MLPFLMLPFSLYVHIPFCGQRCPYCDFNTYVEAKIPEFTYTEALLQELEFRSKLPSWQGRQLQSIFFGGGTPSLFAPASLARIIEKAQTLFKSLADIEISIEVNPGTVTTEYFQKLAQSGINRISIGAQSFNKKALERLGRAHSVEETLNAYQNARAAGYKNINLDLIYALPEQQISDFEQDLSTLTELNPEHISAYQLTIEKGTPFSFRYQQGDLLLPLEDDTILMMELLGKRLSESGYQQYEISNFARAGLSCRHNQAYWDGDDYLGLGAGAHSYSSVEGKGYGRRWSNFALPLEYMQQIATKGESESWCDSLTAEGLKFEFFFLGLRRTSGVSIKSYARRFGEELLDVYDQQLNTLCQQGLLTIQDDLIFLSERGRLLSDSVFEHFITANS